jgi:hypothetical protein
VPGVRDGETHQPVVNLSRIQIAQAVGGFWVHRRGRAGVLGPFVVVDARRRGARRPQPRAEGLVQYSSLRKDRRRARRTAGARTLRAEQVQNSRQRGRRSPASVRPGSS